MKYRDSNKQRREYERRVLKKNGWVAVPALKANGAFQWKWIIAGRKKAYSREEAFARVNV
jgi:hypothetical protein